jgi:hypothetical protein
MTTESGVEKIIARIDAAWRLKAFDGLEECFYLDAVITGNDTSSESNPMSSDINNA